MTDNLVDLLVPTDAPEVQRLTTIVNRLVPDGHPVQGINRAVVTGVQTAPGHVKTDAVRLTDRVLLWHHPPVDRRRWQPLHRSEYAAAHRLRGTARLNVTG